MQEVHYYTYDVLVTYKSCLVHNVKLSIFHHRFLKPSSLENHRSHGNKNTPPFINLITSATDSLPFLISFSNDDKTTVVYIIVNYEATNMDDGTGKSRSGTAIDSEST